MKSPLGEALKTVSSRKEKPRIPVCECGNALVFTFAFAYHEYLCLICGAHYGMMGVEDREQTTVLLAQQKVFKAVWDALYKKGYFLPRGAYQKSGCKKCGPESHNQHITEREKVLNDVATHVFERLTT